MDVGKLVRTWGAVLAFGLGAFGAFTAAGRSDTDVVSTEAVAYELEPATPLLSARRLPLTIQAPVVDEQVEPLLRQAVGESPAATCLRVQVGGRVLGPTANEQVGLVPASNQKILTTYAALRLLGDDFRFTTRVAADNPVVDGVLDGDLYLIGSGDPFLTTEDWWLQYDETEGRFHTRMEDLADRIAATGLLTVTGGIIGDETLFDDARTGPWAERLVAQKQSGPLSALTVNEGFVDWPSVTNGAARQRSETNNPPVHAASVLRRLLVERGITIDGGDSAGQAPSTAVTVASVQSPEMTDIATHINSYSSNIGAELVLKRIGVEESNNGSTAAGAGAMLGLLRADGLPVEGLVLEDGSGLAETNRLTCRLVAALLATTGPDSNLAESLSIGAERGSLLTRFVDTPAARGVLAKTGSLQGVSSLSGYVRSSTRDGVWLVFSYIANEDFINGATVRDLQDALVVGLTEYPGSPTLPELSPLPPLAGG